MVRRKSPEGAGAAIGWSYRIDEGEVRASQPYTRSMTASPAECKAVAARIDVPEVLSLSADVVLTRTPGNKAVIHVTGILKASVVQSCVVTGAPVKAYVEEEFEGWYADPSQFISFAKARNEKIAKGGDVEIPIMEEREDPEPIVDGKIDLGDLVTQYLMLGLDPYPRAHGVESATPEAPPEPPSPLRRNPFEVLKDWKK